MCSSDLRGWCGVSIGNSLAYTSHVGKAWRMTFIGLRGRKRMYECCGCGQKWGIEVHSGGKVPFCLGVMTQHGHMEIELRDVNRYQDRGAV